MTNLENLWDDLPTGKPPVDDILRAGRAGSGVRRYGRPLIAAGAALALVGAFVAGVVVGDFPDPPTDKPQAGPTPVAFQADLDPAKSCEELLTSYRERALELVTESGWGQGSIRGYGPVVADEFSRQLTDLTSGRSIQRLQEQSSGETGTNVQEVGVDEPDTVKTDGDLVARLRGDDLHIYDASGATMVRRSTVHLPRLVDGQILLRGSTVIAIGEDQVSPRDEMTGLRRGSRVITVSIDDPAEPQIESTVTYASRVLSVRQHDSAVRMVLAAGLPALDFAQQGVNDMTRQQALMANRRKVEASTLKDWVPTYDAGKGAKRLLDCTDVAIPPDSLALDTVIIVGFEASEPTKMQTIGLAAATTIAYESADHLYLADGPSPWECRVCMVDRPAPFRYARRGTTHLYDFALDGVFASHIASGEVEGLIADRWSLDEVDDVLRVAVGPSSETGEFNSVVTFDQKGQSLVEIGRVDGLGPNEELKGIRWFDDLAVLVTYRQVDPLYTVDLADPAKPRVIGKLKIPGYSDYLHPVGDNEMIGVGQLDGRGGGAQIALFDTSDLARVNRVDVEHFRGAVALAGTDPRAFTWLPDKRTALTVIQSDRTVYVATVRVGDGKLSSTRTKVELGDDAAQVRTIGLPDGRIALVTGEDVRFFDLP